MKDLQPLKRRNCKTPKCHYTVPKCQIGTLKVLAVLDLIKNNPSVKQTELAGQTGKYFRVGFNKKTPSVKQAELVEQTGKSIRSINHIIDSLKEKQYIRRVDGKWKILI